MEIEELKVMVNDLRSSNEYEAGDMKRATEAGAIERR